MAVGDNSYDGLAVPLFGESEIIQQTAATDILTITGASSQTGDFIACRNSTGGEVFSVSASGLSTMLTFTSAAFESTLSSSATSGAMRVAITATGAMAAGAITANAMLVSNSSKGVINSVVGYNSGGGTEVGSAVAFLSVYGSKAPSYLFSVGSTTAGVGAAADNGFVEVATRFLAAPDTTRTYAAAKVLCGSKVYYIPMVPNTGMADT